MEKRNRRPTATEEANKEDVGADTEEKTEAIRPAEQEEQQTQAVPAAIVEEQPRRPRRDAAAQLDGLTSRVGPCPLPSSADAGMLFPGTRATSPGMMPRKPRTRPTGSSAPGMSATRTRNSPKEKASWATGGGGKGDGKEGKPGEAKGELAEMKRVDGLGAAAMGRAKDLDLAQLRNSQFRRQLEQQQMKDKKPRGGPVAYASMPVREYAHQRLPGSAENRSDFTETLYWHPALVLPNGKTIITFDLCDSVTSFEVDCLCARHGWPAGRLDLCLRFPAAVHPAAQGPAGSDRQRQDRHPAQRLQQHHRPPYHRRHADAAPGPDFAGQCDGRLGARRG